MTLRMLIEGHSDPAASKRLGVSPRTYAGYVADLKEEYDAETRFQLGYEIGRAGAGIEGGRFRVSVETDPHSEPATSSHCQKRLASVR